MISWQWDQAARRFTHFVTGTIDEVHNGWAYFSADGAPWCNIGFTYDWRYVVPLHAPRSWVEPEELP